MAKIKKMKMSQKEDTSSDESDVSISDDDSDSDSGSDTNNGIDSSEQKESCNNENLSEEEDELVKAIMKAKEKVRMHPPDIVCEDFVTDVCFHPHADIIVAATITGDAVLYKYSNESTEVAETFELHSKACRDVEFNSDGSLLYSTSKDKWIMVSDTNSGKLKNAFPNAHDVPVYKLLVIDDHLLASGDDDGTVKLWDLRQQKPIFSLKEMEDYVSSMLTNDSKRHLVCGSGDGSLTTINLTARKLHVKSEPYETEFTSLGLMKSGTKITATTSKGSIYLFNWGEFGYHSDEFPGPKLGINCLIPITENVIVTSGDDGILRATHLFPHRHLGVVGQHDLSVDCIDISNDGSLIASFGHDEILKFWNIKYFEDVHIEKCKKTKRKKDMSHNLPSSKYKNASDFFADLT